MLIKIIISNKNDTVIPFRVFDIEQDVTDEKLKNTVNIIKRIQKHLAEQDKRLYVFLIPSKVLSQANECCSDDNLYSRFYSALTEARIDTIDVKSSFEQINNQRELFFLLQSCRVCRIVLDGKRACAGTGGIFWLQSWGSVGLLCMGKSPLWVPMVMGL